MSGAIVAVVVLVAAAGAGMLSVILFGRRRRTPPEPSADPSLPQPKSPAVVALEDEMRLILKRPE